MKKLILSLAVFTLMCCEIKVQPTPASASKIIPTPASASKIIPISIIGSLNISFDKYVESDMTYGVFYVNNGSSQTGYGIHVVNLTKDKMEIENLLLK